MTSRTAAHPVMVGVVIGGCVGGLWGLGLLLVVQLLGWAP